MDTNLPGIAGWTFEDRDIFAAVMGEMKGDVQSETPSLNNVGGVVHVSVGDGHAL